MVGYPYFSTLQFMVRLPLISRLRKKIVLRKCQRDRTNFTIVFHYISILILTHKNINFDI